MMRDCVARTIRATRAESFAYQASRRGRQWHGLHRDEAVVGQGHHGRNGQHGVGRRLDVHGDHRRAPAMDEVRRKMEVNGQPFRGWDKRSGAGRRWYERLNYDG